MNIFKIFFYIKKLISIIEFIIDNWENKLDKKDVDSIKASLKAIK
jgi:hypothetical protein